MNNAANDKWRKKNTRSLHCPFSKFKRINEKQNQNFRNDNFIVRWTTTEKDQENNKTIK